MNINFSRNLIKGKIAEAIFEEMFRTSEEFTILPLGYEETTPMLAQYQNLLHVKRVLDNLRNAPDFALISQDKTKVFLVEVKYRSEFTKEDILEIAQAIFTKWNPCFLFIASKNGFYFDSVESIIQGNGDIKKLETNWIGEDVQKKFLGLLSDFI